MGEARAPPREPEVGTAMVADSEKLMEDRKYDLSVFVRYFFRSDSEVILRSADVVSLELVGAFTDFPFERSTRLILPLGPIDLPSQSPIPITDL
jgi:hypothetical protein